MTLDDVLEAHERALSFGGLAGINNIGLVESAIGRPYTGYYRRVFEKAAALFHSLASNHGFTDGNKRTAVYVTNLFLVRSGYQLVSGTKERLSGELEALALWVADSSSETEFNEIVEWFKARVIPLND